jgi:hypothetical protein
MEGNGVDGKEGGVKKREAGKLTHSSGRSNRRRASRISEVGREQGGEKRGK